MNEKSGLAAISDDKTDRDSPRRLSAILEEMAGSTDNAITVEQLREALGDRSFATLLVLFSLFNMLPWPPGSTLILGIPLLLLSIQMVMGRRTVWLPEFILQKSIGAEKFRQLSSRLKPRLQWVEQLIRPRYWPFARDHADRIIGSIALVMAIAVALPIPFGNWFPALSCALTGLALSERDGLLLGVAVAVGIFAILLMAAVIGAAGTLAEIIFT